MILRICLISILFIALLSLTEAKAQELFVATEPASNLPKNSVRLRLSNESVLKSDIKGRTDFGIMYGLSKDVLLRANAYMSDSISESRTSTGIRSIQSIGFSM